MSKENLFQLLKREELIVWAGAGMSRYCGYPDGNSLRGIIVDDLGPEGQAQISPTATLMDLAEAYVELKGGSRRDLISLLNRIFRSPPNNLAAHQELSLIPQIRTIITTNYDNSFEIAYGGKAQSFHKSSQVTQLDRNLVQVFKAHGSLDDPDSIVISRTDYKKFLEKDVQNSVYWTVIKERIVNNSVLFIGYGLEDLNTGMIIDKILNELEQNRRECFFAAPNLPQYKIASLLRSGIHYIDTTGEALVSEMLSHLKDNILSAATNEVQVGNVSTVSKFLGNFNLGSTTDFSGGKDRITSVYPVKHDTLGTLKFRTKEGSEFDKQLREFMTRPGSTPLNFKHGGVEDFEFRLAGIKIPLDPSDIMFGAMPNIEESVVIRFDSGFEYADINLKVFGSEAGVELDADLRGGKINIWIPRSDIRGSDFTTGFKFIHDKFCKRLPEEIDLFNFLTKLTDGTPFTVFTSKGPIRCVSNVTSKSEHDDFSDCLRIFETLKLIENYYGLLFTDFEFCKIDDHAIGLINRVVTRMNEAKYVEAWDGVIDVRTCNRTLLPKDIEPLINNTATQVTMRGSYVEKITLFSQVIKLGYPIIEILSPKLTNRKDFLKDNATPLIIRSAIGKRNVYYSDLYEGPDPKNADFVILMGVPIEKGKGKVVTPTSPGPIAS